MVPLICALAVAANVLVMLFWHLLWFPLFVDTIFTVVVTFVLGIVPGLVVATLTWATDGALGLGFSLVLIYRYHAPL